MRPIARPDEFGLTKHLGGRYVLARLAPPSRWERAEGAPDTTTALCASACRGEWLGREGQVHHHQPEVRAPHQFGEVRISSDPGGVPEPLRDRHLEQGRCAVLIFPSPLRIASSRGAAGE